MALLWRELPSLRASGRRLLSSAAHRSVKVSVGGGVELHALVPVAAAGSKPPVVCLPSAFGAVQDDFAAQFAALGGSYAFVGVDPRGYGLSRPPRRDFPDKYFERDADDVVRVLDQLGYDQVALLGWSAGANTSAVLAGKYPDRVSRLVLVAGNAFVGDEDAEVFDKVENVANWSRSARERGEAMYGAEELQAGWSEMCNALRAIYERDGDLYCEWLPRIRCKTLVVSGGKDKMVADFHGEYLSERIAHSRLHVVSEGRHDLVIGCADEFNSLLNGFLQEPDDKLTQSREFVAVPAKK